MASEAINCQYAVTFEMHLSANLSLIFLRDAFRIFVGEIQSCFTITVSLYFMF